MRSEITHQLKEKRHFVFRLEHAKLYSSVNRGDVLAIQQILYVQNCFYNMVTNDTY